MNLLADMRSDPDELFKVVFYCLYETEWLTPVYPASKLLHLSLRPRRPAYEPTLSIAAAFRAAKRC
jgi:hypothetical protein